MTPSHERRHFMKLAGGVVGAGALQATTGAVAATTQEELPALRGPYADEDWVEYRSGPGNTAAIAAGLDVDPGALEVATLYDGQYIGSQCAVVGDTMYVAGGGHVRALDTHDGSVRWTSEDVGASGAPAAAYGRIITAGGTNPVVALDVEDGSLDWKTNLEGVASTPTVAYETVYVVADGTLYALDVTDGSVRWERTPEADGAGFLNRPPAASDGQVYAVLDPGEGDYELVALTAGTGEPRWRDAWHYLSTPAATAAYVAASNGGASERFRALDTDSGDPVLEGSAITVPSLDDEAAVTILDYSLQASFFGDREGWRIDNFSTGAIGEPTIAGDTVYAYVGEDHREEYRYSLLAVDKHSGEVEWTVDLQASSQGLGVGIVATADALYVFHQDAIYVVREGSGNGDDGSGGDSGGDDDTSTPEETSTPDETATPEETPTPEETSTPTDEPSTPEESPTPEGPTDTECGCPNGSSTTDTTPGSDGTTTSATATDEDSVAGNESGSTGQDYQALDEPTVDGETDGAGPGFGVASALGSLGGIAYVLRRRLGVNESDGER